MNKLSELERLHERKATYRFMMQMASQGIIINLVASFLLQGGMTIPLLRPELNAWLPWVLFSLVLASISMLVSAFLLNNYINKKIMSIESAA